MAPIWIPSLIISLLFVIKLFRRKISDKELFLLLWLVSNLHVLLLLLDFQASQYAVLSVMAAVFFIDFRKPSTNGKKILVYAALAFIILLSLSLNIYSEYNLQTTRHAFYNQEIDAANYVKERTIQGEPIYVFGYRPSIYILSQRDPPATVPVMANFNIQIKGKYENETISALQNIRYIVHETMTPPGEAPAIYKFIQENYNIETTIGRFIIYIKK